MTEQDHVDLVRLLLDSKNAMFILSGYDTPLYDDLCRSGWKKDQYSVIAHSTWDRVERLETLWISPNLIQKLPKRRGIMNLGDTLFQELSDKQSLAAFHTHKIRKEDTEQRITAEVKRFKRLGRKITQTAIAEAIGIARETISRSYSHLLKL